MNRCQHERRRRWTSRGRPGHPPGDQPRQSTEHCANVSFDPTIFNAQTITLNSGTLVLSNTQTIESIVGPTAGLTITGNGTAGVFLVNAGVTAGITNLTISGGSAISGGGVDNNGSLALSNLTVTGNTATTGGGIFNNGFLTIVNSTISGNTATSNGGGATSAAARRQSPTAPSPTMLYPAAQSPGRACTSMVARVSWTTPSSHSISMPLPAAQRPTISPVLLNC